MGEIVGYARVSTRDQDALLQHDALREVGVERVFTDVASGARADRPQLHACLAYLRPGDTLVVWRLDRLGRSLRHLVEVVDELRERGVQFRSLAEAFDTSTSAGSMIFHVFAAVAQFERDLIRERTRAGLEAARRQGRVGGRSTVMTAERLRVARQMRREGASVRAIADTLGVGKTTVARHLAVTEAGTAATASVEGPR